MNDKCIVGGYIALENRCMKSYYVYILLCSDDTFYTGITSNLTARMVSHNRGEYSDSYTFSRRPVSIVYYAEFTNPEVAIEVEKQIKKWSRAKKEALMKGDYESLMTLAKKKFNN